MSHTNLATQRAAVMLLAATALASCTTTVTGSPSPHAPRLSTSASVPDRGPSGAPRVTHPLDTTAFRQAPCTMLTTAQQAEFKIRTPGVPRRDPLGAVCGWDDGRGPSGMTLTTGFVTTGHGLSGSYINHALGVVPGFREMPPIRGYPAVIANVDATDEAEGMCNVGVGTSDDEVVTIVVQISGDEVRQPDQHDPCPRALRITDEVMKTMERP